MYKHVLVSEDSFFAKKMPLPANTEAVCEKVLPIGKHGGGLGLYIRASEPLTLAANKTISVLFENSDDGTTFTDAEPSFSFMFASGLSLSAGDKVLLMPLPDLSNKVRVSLATDDTSAKGSVDVCVNVLAR